MTPQNSALAHQHLAVQRLLLALAAELRAQDLWSPTAPSATAMSSVIPFMYDTLRFQEWLQWVFIPRTQALIDAGRPLPDNCHIHPLAEHELPRACTHPATVLSLILQIDNAMNPEPRSSSEIPSP